MASNHCKWIPDAPNGKQSKLFVDIDNHFHNRKMSAKLWALTTLDIFKDRYPDIEKDENGEPTYAALEKALNLKSIFSEAQNEINRAIEMHLIDKNGKPQIFEYANGALSLAAEFNKTAKRKIAIVRETQDGKYRVSVVDNTAKYIAEADKNEARRELNSALITILQRIGFNVEFVDNPSFYGVFDPLIADKNARNLKTVIQVAHGEKGLNALPEEACHLILAGMKNHPLKIRLDSAMNETVIKEILGDEYDAYYEKYADSSIPVEDMLREEAEGKLLYQHLTGKGTDAMEAVGRDRQHGMKSLLTRIWNWAKSLFQKSSTADIDNAYVNAQNAIQPIADLINSGEVETVISKEAVMKHQALYKLYDDIEDARQLAQDGETILSKKLYIMSTTARTNPKSTKVLRQNINNIRAAIESENYAIACFRILSTITNDMKNITEEMRQKSILKSNSHDLSVISDQADLVERINLAVQGYTPYLKVLVKLPELVKEGKINISNEWADTITEKAKKVLDQLRDMKEDDIKELRLAVLKQLISLYYGNYGNKPDNFTETERFKWESTEMILTQASQDIGWGDTNFFSAGDSKSPLINVVHKIVVAQQAKRNNRINKNIARMQEAHIRLHRAGHSDEFVYDLDEKGNPTGYYKSDRDFARFRREREEFIKSLDPEKYDFYDRQDAIQKWEDERTERVAVGNHFEFMPKKELYGIKDFQKGWTQAQKDYYAALIEMKTDMDDLLPGPMRQLYFAPQVRKSTSQLFDKGVKKGMKTMWNNFKKSYLLVDEYNQDYAKGMEIEDDAGEKHVITDFEDKAIQRVPVYYVHEIKDKNDLSTDATHAMCNYIAMSVNYSEMTKLASAMRLLKEHVKNDYAVVQKDGSRVIIDMFKAFKRKYKREFVKKGEATRTVRALEEYIDRQFFNDTKAKLGTTEFKNEEGKVMFSLNWDAIFNGFMRLTSVARMGFNILSGITNATQGETQMISEATAKRFFNLKDLAWTKKEYNKLLLGYLEQFNSVDRHDKMYMLINQFNSSEDYFRDMQDKDFNKSAFKRVMGKGNVYFLNTMGEHYLHTSGMLAILHHEKVKRLSDGKEMTLYDAIKQVHDKDGWHLELDGDIEFLDKNRAFLNNNDLADRNGIIRKDDRDLLFDNLAMYINSINAGMHGGYSESEKGNINRQAIGRLILQFRQWMFGMYNKNFGKKYYEASTGLVREGTYRTLFRYIVSLLYDAKNVGIKAAINNNQLTSAEKRNVRVALSQVAIFVLLHILSSMTAGWKDKDDRATRLLAYQIRRLEMETGALVPWPPTFIKNITQIIQSPAAGSKSFETLGNLLDLTNFWNEVQSGRYKGWNKGLKALYTLTPIYNVGRIIDMHDYNYMFNIFN